MVYCSKCGTRNDDDVSNCINCGEPLNSRIRDNRGWEEEIEARAEEFGRRAERFGRRMSSQNWDVEDECYGGRGRTIWPIFMGCFIILIGLSFLLEDTYSWANFDNIWPLFLMALGIVIIYDRLR